MRYSNVSTNGVHSYFNALNCVSHNDETRCNDLFLELTTNDSNERIVVSNGKYQASVLKSHVFESHLRQFLIFLSYGTNIVLIAFMEM